MNSCEEKETVEDLRIALLRAAENMVHNGKDEDGTEELYVKAESLFEELWGLAVSGVQKAYDERIVAIAEMRPIYYGPSADWDGREDIRDKSFRKNVIEPQERIYEDKVSLLLK